MLKWSLSKRGLGKYQMLHSANWQKWIQIFLWQLWMLMVSIPKIRRRRLANWIWKQDPPISCLQEPRLASETNNTLGWKGGKGHSKQMELGKTAGIAVLTSNKIDFIVKLIRQDEEGHSHQSKGKPAKRELHLRTLPQQTQVTQLH